MNEIMDEPPTKRKKSAELTKHDLLQLSKEDLVEQILQIRSHNTQLSNILNKNNLEGNKKHNAAPKRKFDFSKCHYRRVLLRLMYLGWDYQGYTTQEYISSTIEHHLFQALTKTCLIEARENSHYHRCGRTDKGVSAFGQVISITVRSTLEPEDQYNPAAFSKELPYCRMLNKLLPKDIRVISWMPIPVDKPQYSARFNCKKRQYKYYFPRGNLNISAMKEACSYLVGSHDFRHLCKMDVTNGIFEYTREIFKADILSVDEVESELPTSMYYLLIEANAFLWHQIRCIMGILLLVGENKEDANIIKDLLNIEENQRKPQYNLALDIPLNLFQSSYDLEVDNSWVYPQNELRSIIGDLQKEWTTHNIKSTMIKDCLQQLETTYSSLCEKETDYKGDALEGDRVMQYTKGLLQGVRSRMYRPVFERGTCLSLDEKIDSLKRRMANSTSFAEKRGIILKKIEKKEL